MFGRLDELGILQAIHPDLYWDDWIKEHIENLDQPPSEWNLDPVLRGIPIRLVLSYTLWMIRLPKSQSRGIVKRLRLARNIKSFILAACQLWDQRPNFEILKPSEISERLRKIPRVSIYAVYLATDSPVLREKLKSFVMYWEKITPLTDGHVLCGLGLPPGPVFKEIINQLRSAWIDGEVKNNEEETALLNRLLQDRNKRNNI